RPLTLTVMLMLVVVLSKIAVPRPVAEDITTGTCCAPSREMRNAVDMCCPPGWQRPIARRRHGDATFCAGGARNPSPQWSEAGAPIRLADTAARCAIAAKHPLSTVIPARLAKADRTHPP